MLDTNHTYFPKKPLCNNKGVTLIELMITVAISGFVIAAIYMSYKAQQRASTFQQEVGAMQQNLRAASLMMSSEIRMAGYDPTESTGATITAATSTSLSFTMDLAGNGNLTDSDDNVTYSLYTAAGNIPTLGRSAPSLNQAVAEYIEDLEFIYLDSNSIVTGTLANIRSIIITLQARSRLEDPDYVNNIVYQTANGINPVTGDANATATYGDGFRRRQLINTINCRNMGL